MKKQIKRKGVSYILVIVIITICTSLVVMLYVSAKMSLDNTEIYSKYSNNYFMAVSGVEKLKSSINVELFNKVDIILLNAQERIVTKNKLDDILYFKDGEFYFKNVDKNGVKGEKDILYKSNIFMKFLDEYMKYLNYSFSYEINNEFNDYIVEVNSEIIKYPEIKIRSKATELNNGTSTTVEGIIKLKQGYEKVKIQLMWRNIIIPFEYSMVCDTLFLDEKSYIEATTFENYEVGFDYFYSDVLDEDKIILTDAIDISRLNEQDYYIIYSNGNLDVTNTAGVSFKGVIISLGNINFIDYNGEISGNVIAKENINLINSNISIMDDNNAIFKINYTNSELYFKLLDAIGITNVKSSENEVVDTADGLNAILNNAKIYKIKNIELENLEFIITELVQK